MGVGEDCGGHMLPAGARGEFLIMHWQSCRQDRQTHSTLGAELPSRLQTLVEARRYDGCGAKPGMKRTSSARTTTKSAIFLPVALL